MRQLNTVRPLRLDTTTQDQRDREGLIPAEVIDIEGPDMPDWEAAKRACQVPDTAQLIAWINPEYRLT